MKAKRIFYCTTLLLPFWILLFLTFLLIWFVLAPIYLIGYGGWFIKLIVCTLNHEEKEEIQNDIKHASPGLVLPFYCTYLAISEYLTTGKIELP